MFILSQKSDKHYPHPDYPVPFLTAAEVEHCRTIKTIATPVDLVSLAIIDRLVRLLDEITERDDLERRSK